MSFFPLHEIYVPWPSKTVTFACIGCELFWKGCLFDPATGSSVCLFETMGDFLSPGKP